MNGLGVIINILSVVVAGGIGTLFRGKCPVRYQTLILQLCGLVALAAGFYGAWTGLIVMADGQFAIRGTALILFSLLFGYLLGDLLNVDGLMGRFGCFIAGKCDRKNRKGVSPDVPSGSSPAAEEVRPQNGKRHGRKHRSLAEMPTYPAPLGRTGYPFADGFLIACSLVSVGSLGVKGIADDILLADSTMIYVKIAVDVVLVLLLSAVYGTGVSFCVVPMILLEGLVAGIAHFSPAYLTVDMTGYLNTIGAFIMIGEGCNLCFGKKWKMLNLWPAFLIPPAYTFLASSIGKADKKKK